MFSLVFTGLVLGYLWLPSAWPTPTVKAQTASSSCLSSPPVPPTSTNLVAAYYGTNTLSYGQPVTVGSVIAACDPDGVKAGVTTVITPGWYYIQVLGDDTGTSKDEGALPGDTIAFYINGAKAIAAGPDDPTWQSMPANPLHVDLVAPLAATIYLPAVLRSP